MLRIKNIGLVWGKEENLKEVYALVAHMLDSAALVLALAEDDAPLLPDALKSLGADGIRCLALLAGLHDIGKATTGFAAQEARGWRPMWQSAPAVPRNLDRGHTAPAQASAVLDEWVAYLVGEGLDPDDARLFVGVVLGSHHGRVPPAMTALQAARVMDGCGDALADWPEVRRQLVLLLWEALERPRLTLDEADRTMAAVAACGLVPLADWIVSQVPYIEGARVPELPDEWTSDTARAFLNSGIEHAGRELDRIGVKPLVLDVPDFGDWFGFAPRGVQISVCGEFTSRIGGPGLLLVMDSPGRGKSEAALEAFRCFRDALGQDRGLAFFLPTMATTDAMFGRLVRRLHTVLGRDATVELLHSMASVSEEADRVLRELYAETDVDSASAGAHATDAASRLRLSDWNGKAVQRMHSALTVGTVDQLLAAVLPGRHQPFRLSSLFGKVVVVDECHAYDAYMQVLLRRVLRWLAAFGIPVVLLSATLPARLATRLVDSYHQGARTWRKGRNLVEPEPPSFTVSYPGLVHYDSRRGDAHVLPADPGRPAHLHMRRTQVSLRSRSGRDAAARGRAVAEGVWEVLGDRITATPGNVLVIVNTVAAAQITAALLRERVPPDCGVEVLHSAMPGLGRRNRTNRLEGLFGRQDPGRPSRRPERSVVVATQVAEQSLDWDFDAVVSELAPLSLLLQRAGRAHRHRGREQVPQGWQDWTLHVVAVVDPDTGEPAELLPYPHAELIRTWKLLGDREDTGKRTVRIPHDVQELVDLAAQDPSWLTSEDEALAEAAMSCWAEENVQVSLGEQCVVPAPDALYEKNLYQLTEPRGDVDQILSTRLGATTRRVLPVWRTGDRLFLDPDGGSPLPASPGKGRKPGHAAVRTVLDHAVPSRQAPWQDEARIDSPDWFGRHPLLNDVVLVPFRREGGHRPVPGLEGLHGHATVLPVPGHRVALSDDTGLFAVRGQEG